MASQLAPSSVTWLRSRSVTSLPASCWATRAEGLLQGRHRSGRRLRVRHPMLRRERVPAGHPTPSLGVVDQSHTVPVPPAPRSGSRSRIHTKGHRQWPGAVTAANIHDSVAASELVDRVMDEPGRELKLIWVNSAYQGQAPEVTFELFRPAALGSARESSLEFVGVLVGPGSPPAPAPTPFPGRQPFSSSGLEVCGVLFTFG